LEVLMQEVEEQQDGTRKGRAKTFHKIMPSAYDQAKQHEKEEQDRNQHRGDKEDQQVVLPTWRYWYRK